MPSSAAATCLPHQKEAHGRFWDLFQRNDSRKISGAVWDELAFGQRQVPHKTVVYTDLPDVECRKRGIPAQKNNEFFVNFFWFC